MNYDIFIIPLLLLIIYLYLKRCRCKARGTCSGKTFKSVNVWMDHFLYTRLVLMAALDNSPNLDVLVKRLNQNQNDIASLFGKDQDTVKSLLLTHIQLAIQAVQDVKSNSPSLQDDLTKLYANATEIGQYLDQRAHNTQGLFVHHMKMHIDTLVKMVQDYNDKKYADDIQDLDAYTQAGLQMAFDMAPLLNYECSQK